MDKQAQLIPEDDLNMSTSTLGTEYRLGTQEAEGKTGISGGNRLHMQYHSKPLDRAPTLDEPLKVTIVNDNDLDARPRDDFLQSEETTHHRDDR